MRFKYTCPSCLLTVHAESHLAPEALGCMRCGQYLVPLKSAETDLSPPPESPARQTRRTAMEKKDDLAAHSLSGVTREITHQRPFVAVAGLVVGDDYNRE